MTSSSEVTSHDVVIVGGGAAGVGVAIALKHAGVENFLVLERHAVGASFAAWPDETRFITPSFPSNSIGMLDLNSIAIGISPAFSLEVEHPTGKDYAAHLQGVAKFFELPVRERTKVKQISKTDNGFEIKTNTDTLLAKNVIWAAGEYQYPRLSGFAGSEYCQHTSTVASYEERSGDDFIVIGGYESGVDAAYHLSYHDKRVQLLDRGCPWKTESSDPSIALSTYSQERMREDWFEEFVDLFPKTSVVSVTVSDDVYEVTAEDGRKFHTRSPPLLAGGFEGSHKLVTDLFEQRDDGFPLLNDNDESTIVPGMFLCGPAVRHQNHVFCFIYKYRQRFAVVAKAIATSLGLAAEELEGYRQWGMYLDDLSCCGEECEAC
ncbi:MAG: NAD(P)/FAD-dependent oxidoreductase [Fuerstiella sp.]